MLLPQESPLGDFLFYNKLMKNCSKCHPGVVAAPAYNKASACEQPPTQLETVKIPKNKGGDGPNDLYAPKLGAWQNTVVQYEKTGSVYLYDANGVFTNLTGTDYAAQILALQDSMAAQGDLLQELDTDLAAEKKARIEADGATSEYLTHLSTQLNTETQTRKEADDGLASQIAGFNAQLNDIGTQVDENAADIKADVAALQTNINQLANKEAEDVADLQTNINANTTAIANLQGLVSPEGLGKELVLDVTTDASVAAVNLNITKGTLGTTDTTESTLALPVASATQAGVLSAADFAIFQAAQGVEVAQTTGTSETSVMSQNAVTTALQGLFSYNATTKTLTINSVS